MGLLSLPIPKIKARNMNTLELIATYFDEYVAYVLLGWVCHVARGRRKFTALPATGGKMREEEEDIREDTLVVFVLL